MKQQTNQSIMQMKGKLIVSCQALPDEPLHSSFIMGRMALAAKTGGACGIRANTKEDILEIQSQVCLPIIGIVKRDYSDSSVYITPTFKEVEELMEVQPEIIALDATGSLRPGNMELSDFFFCLKERYPSQLWMADCSTVEEALYADALGFDFIGTTMVGYTPQSKGMKIEADDFSILRQIIQHAEHPVIAEGNIDTPAKAKRVIELGAFCVVVGSVITRPQLITRSFAQALKD
ncbi:MAG: N-acetylmannosamine-6-phosphate 2-epimerase [Eubacterium sp.]|nr:N-acetylmannosamine-6-phosphate 2-epimerase [Eubacterium sp.]